MNFKILTFLLCFLFASGLRAQEIITSLQRNEAVRVKHEKMMAESQLKQFRNENNSSLTLPFFDDFKTSSVYPNQNLWQGNSVFINENFPYFPPNINAATFDALDSTGKVYGNSDWIPFEADVLLSKPIRLDSVFSPIIRKLSPADSVYFSFYYQPQGYGNPPEDWDTLLLEFATLGQIEFQYIDSVMVYGSDYLASDQDTIRPGDVLFAPSGCIL